MSKLPRVLSGMRPTGRLHIGHLIGTLNKWVELQQDYACLFMVADWHALMSSYVHPEGIRENIFLCVVDWLACGIDPDKVNIFIQSEIKEHLELFFILSCITPLGWLERCPTYKEQIAQGRSELKNYAFLGYPVLQASDILLYKAEFIPVGQDQLAHIELCREILRRFSHLYKGIFPEPREIMSTYNRLLGLDGRKMSKSYNNCIYLSDPPEIIREKVKGMFTDPKRIRRYDKGHPRECNVCSYYSFFAPKKREEVYTYCMYAEKGCSECKEELAEIIISSLDNIQIRQKSLRKDRRYIYDILDKGRDFAKDIAASTMKEVKEVIRLKDNVQ